MMRINQFISDINRNKLQRNTALTVIGLVALIAISYSVAGVEDRSDSQTIIERVGCKGCHNRQNQMTEYFKKAGSKSPDEMASAVLATKSPRLLAAVATVESNGNPSLRNTGYKKKYSGAFQTHPMWGKIDKNTTVTEQALIAEFAIATHISESGDFIKGINAYGGDVTKKKYANVILSELERVP